MFWSILMQIFSTLIGIVSIGWLSEREKDLEILVLRKQLEILERKQEQPIRPKRAEKLTLVVLTAKLKALSKRPTRKLGNSMRLFKPETVLGWHRELVRRKWSYARKNKGGRPRIDQESEALIVRLAKENTRWGYERIQGKLLKLGFEVHWTTVHNGLDRHGIEPAPVRNSMPPWVWIHWLAADDRTLQRADSGYGFLHGGNYLSANPVRALLHRSGHTSGVSSWGDF